MATTIHIPVPDGFRELLEARAPDDGHLTRWSLEALVIETYREGFVSRGKVGDLLGLSFHDREAWLKERDVPYAIDEADLAHDRATLNELFDR